jgi:hypothetical protein
VGNGPDLTRSYTSLKSRLTRFSVTRFRFIEFDTLFLHKNKVPYEFKAKETATNSHSIGKKGNWMPICPHLANVVQVDSRSNRIEGDLNGTCLL